MCAEFPKLNENCHLVIGRQKSRGEEILLIKSKGISIFAITLIIFQIFSSTFSVSGVSEAANHRDADMIHVNAKQVTDEKITWEVKINKAAHEIPEAKTTLTFGSGLEHDSISEVENVTINKVVDGYQIETPASSDTYTIEVVSNIEDEMATRFQLQAKMVLEDDLYEASEEVTVEPKSEEGEAPSNQNENEHLSDMNDEEQNTEEKGKEEGESREELASTEDESFSENNALPFKASMFPNALPSVMSGENWPAPGSIKLDKKATATSNFAEWEVELAIEGKNLKTSTDIVLVFDKSGSMNDCVQRRNNRCQKTKLSFAKEAANEFVDNLLINGSSTRIALVEFSTNSSLRSDFKSYNQRNQLKNSISSISASGGTNIQSGLRYADTLLSNSTADQKIIVLLSDGEPTYSHRANNAQRYTWPNNKYNFILSNFNYNNRIGSGNNYYLSTNQQYTRNGYQVRDNGIPTLSEARHIMNRGIGIYSIGLGVSGNSDAEYVLQNSQNKGYYLGNAEDLSDIFNDIAGTIAYPASEIQITDPLGDMFDLVTNGSYSGQNFEVSHGSVNWDEATETFTWNFDHVKEGEVYKLKYKITIDCTKNPQANVSYPTNKTTTMNYKNYNGMDSSKQFPIPKVKVDKGQIIKLGYRVNAAGEPVDISGNVVSSIEDAQQFYKELYRDNLTLNRTYSVPAGSTPEGYQLHVGTDPTNVRLTEICTVVPFGYVDMNELDAGDVIVKYVDEDGNEVADTEVLSGQIGDTYTAVKKDIEGYEFVRMREDSANPEGTFTSEEQTVIFVYKKLFGSIIVNKVDEDEEPLAGAQFTLTGPNGYSVTKSSNSDGEIIFDDLAWGVYTLKETKAPAGYRLLTKEYTFEITENNLQHTITLENSKQDWSLPKTGGVGTLGFYGIGLILIAGAGWLLFRRKLV